MSIIVWVVFNYSVNISMSSSKARPRFWWRDLMRAEGQKNHPHYGIVSFEKRKHPRFSVDLPIEYCKVGSLFRHTGKAMNASEGGLLLYLSEQVEIGQYLGLKLFLSSNSKLNVIEMIAEVVWKDIVPKKDWGDYRIGVKFVDISPENMTELKNFLINLSR